MGCVKLFRAAAPLVVAVCLAGAGTPALAGGVKLSPVGDEPNARGIVHVAGKYYFDASVSCQGLTPGATYGATAHWVVWDPHGGDYGQGGYYWQTASLGGFVADQRGAGRCEGTYQQTTPYSDAFFVVGRDGVTQPVLSSR